MNYNPLYRFVSQEERDDISKRVDEALAGNNTHKNTHCLTYVIGFILSFILMEWLF